MHLINISLWGFEHTQESMIAIHLGAFRFKQQIQIWRALFPFTLNPFHFLWHVPDYMPVGHILQWNVFSSENADSPKVKCYAETYWVWWASKKTQVGSAKCSCFFHSACMIAPRICKCWTFCICDLIICEIQSQPSPTKETAIPENPHSLFRSLQTEKA